jgi:hypothetical protein
MIELPIHTIVPGTLLGLMQYPRGSEYLTPGLPGCYFFPSTTYSVNCMLTFRPPTLIVSSR